MTDRQDDAPDFARRYINLASPRLGTEVLSATDDFFADKSRLIKDDPPVFIADKYDDNGKWMDGWESRRKRGPGHDSCEIKLGLKAVIRGIDFDTSHFTGNYPPAASLEARRSDGDDGWTEIVASQSLGPNAHHFAEVTDGNVYDMLRFHIYPDGGVARLRVYGEPVAEWQDADANAVYELSALKNGGRIVAYNDAHYGSVWTLLTEGRGVNMGDGWETRRRREPGNDWIIIALGAAGTVEAIEVDTCHFKGNFPDACSVQAASVTGGTDDSIITQSMFWPELLPAQKLSADTIHTFDAGQITADGPVTHVRLNIHPDGGVSRFRVFGKLA